MEDSLTAGPLEELREQTRGLADLQAEDTGIVSVEELEGRLHSREDAIAFVRTEFPRDSD